LEDYNIIIEVDGDFWHGNPKFYNENKGNLRDHQILKRKDDKIKEMLLIDSDYNIIRFWEDDIYHNFDYVKTIILKKINDNEKNNIKNIKNNS
jgi:very-short-patch-repair endonuclease